MLAQERPNTPSVSRLESPWNKWLNEDVAYIITDRERQTFKALRTDEERANFVEQFWLRRDPTPGTSENESKEEHYRRIAFANQHFASTVPGWKTDRGRIYITFGPPDAIESHPAGGTYERPAAQGGTQLSAWPFEDWLYRYIEGIGNDVSIEFVDRAMNGECYMTMDPSEKDALLNPPPANGSTLAGPVAVQVMPDRRPLVQLPLFGAMFQALVTVSPPNGQPASSVAFAGFLCGNTFKPGCLTEPFYRPDLKPLEPGTYVLHAIIMDAPSGTRHSYTIPFTVN